MSQMHLWIHSNIILIIDVGVILMKLKAYIMLQPLKPLLIKL